MKVTKAVLLAEVHRVYPRKGVPLCRIPVLTVDKKTGEFWSCSVQIERVCIQTSGARMRARRELYDYLQTLPSAKEA